ncbi:MAG: hypothetical protein K6T65_02370 [Peptococcaceae bacterium]|nr:hypothetical protein [Peptococcaceae bacterium]
MTGSRARPQKKGRKRALALASILFVCGLFIIYIGVVQIWNFTRSNLIKTANLNTGDLKKLYLAEGVLVRDEAVIASPADGQLILLVGDGERVRVGDSIAEVKTAGDGAGSPVRSALISAPRAGVVTCQVDGLESVLNPDQVDILEVAGAKLKSGQPAGPDDGNKKCRKGQPVMKIIDNLSPLVICLQVPDGFPPDRIKKGGSIMLAWENIEFTGRIANVRDRGGRPEVIIKTTTYPSGLLYKRKVFLSLVGGTVSGYIVPVGSLVEREGQKGIYIMNKQQFRWVPVKVEGEVDDHAAVSGEHIVPGTRYAVNPRWFFARS